MAFIKLDQKKLQHNYQHLQNLFQSRNIEWGIVSKILCGNKLFINEIINLGVKEIHDSRISNLKIIKEIAPDVQTVYIKPPAKRSISKIVKYADVSFNTEIDTIKMLSEEAKRQNKVHKIVIMIEMGDLREGVLGEELLHFYQEVFSLPNIKISGIGTNFYVITDNNTASLYDFLPALAVRSKTKTVCANYSTAVYYTTFADIYPMINSNVSP